SRGERGPPPPAPAAAAPPARRPPAQEAATGPLEGERKIVTALFADMKGSMELIEDLDPEDARAIVDPAIARMIDAVHHYDGYIVQSTGDGSFALFCVQRSRQEHPPRSPCAA